MQRNELHRLFAEKFGRDDVTLFNLSDLMYRKRWLNGLTGAHVLYSKAELRFLERHKKMPRVQLHALFVKQFGRSVTLDSIKDTCSRHGFLTHRATDNAAAEIGTERVRPNGFIVVKVSRGRSRKNFVLKHRMLWERLNGPIPSGYRLKCLSEDIANTDPSNWTCVKIGVISRLRKRNFTSAPPELKPTIIAVSKLEHEIRMRAAE